MKQSLKINGNMMRRPLAIVGVCIFLITLQMGCKSGEAWAPKMPKFGVPALAFGTKSKASDKVEPPAMSFTPDQADQTRMANNNVRPTNTANGAELLGQSSPSRSPYNVDQEDSSTSALASGAAQRQEAIKSDVNRLAGNRSDLGSGGFGQDMASKTELPGRSIDNSITNSNLLDSSNSGTGFADVRSIPGGPIGNPYPRTNSPLPGAVQPRQPQDAIASLPKGFNSNGSSSNLTANTLPPTLGGTSPTLGGTLPGNPSSSGAGLGGFPALPPPPSGSSLAYDSSQRQLVPPPPLGPEMSNSQQPNLAAQGMNSGLGGAANIPAMPGNEYNKLATAVTPDAPTSQAATPVRPNPGAGFRPGSIASASGLPAFPTANPNRPSVSPTSPLAVPQGYQQTPTQSYPTTPHGSFRPQTDNVQPSNYQSSSPTSDLPAFPVKANFGQGPAGSLNSASTHAVGAPEGMVCVGDQCSVPQ